MFSDNVSELFAALSKAQAQIKGAAKDSANPFFKSKYADLESVWGVIRAPLADNGLCVIQTIQVYDDGTNVLETILAHSSGQWVKSVAPLKPVKDDPQGLGSCISYMRRYSLAAITGVFQTDDDGNHASGKTDNTHAKPVQQEPKFTYPKPGFENDVPMQWEAAPATPAVSVIPGPRKFQITPADATTLMDLAKTNKGIRWTPKDINAYIKEAYGIERLRDINEHDYGCLKNLVEFRNPKEALEDCIKAKAAPSQESFI